MKTLIEHNFLYYLKNRTKLLLSILFIASFIGMIALYDNLELKAIKNEVIQLRLDSYVFNEKRNQIIYDNQGLSEMEEDELSDEQKKSLEVASKSAEIFVLLDNLATQQSGGRLNAELTPYRLEITANILELKDLLSQEDFDKLLSETSINTDNLELEHKRLEKLMGTLTADDFNEYTLTAHNLLGNVFQGYFLLMIFVFTLLLFYDLFSKDYDHRTYQILFSEPIERKAIFTSKLVFAVIYSIILIVIGSLVGFIYLLLVKRMGYNVIPSRIGYFLHPVLLNINPLTIFGMAPKVIIIPMFIYNLISLITGSFIISFWIMLLLTISFKLKSSSNTLTMAVFIMIAVFFISLTPVREVFIYIFPLFNYSFYASLHGDASMNFIYIWLLSGALTYLTYRYYIKDVETIDILGGDTND